MIVGARTTRLPVGLRFGTTVLLIKTGSGSYVDGYYIEGAQEVTTLKANVQAASQDDRENLDIGERVTEILAVYIQSDERDLIRPLRQGVENSRGDIIRINQIDYEAYSVDNYSINGHIKALCVRRENQNG